MEAHALLDLFTDTFSKVPDAGSIDMNEVTSRMAVKAGVPPELITGFMNTFDRVVDEMDKEGVLFSPADILGRIRRKG